MMQEVKTRPLWARNAIEAWQAVQVEQEEVEKARQERETEARLADFGERLRRLGIDESPTELDLRLDHYRFVPSVPSARVLVAELCPGCAVTIRADHIATQVELGQWLMGSLPCPRNCGTREPQEVRRGS